MKSTRRTMALACAALLAAFTAQAQGAMTGPEALRQIHGKRTVTHNVELKTASKVRIGKDPMEFTVKSSKPGFVYVLMAAADNKTVTVLFPNRLDSNNNRIAAGQEMKLPRPAWPMNFVGPPGTNTMLVMVADGPRNLTAMRLVGEFLMAETADERAVMATQIMRNGGANNPKCKEGGTIQESPLCSNAYGAAMATVEEVQ